MNQDNTISQEEFNTIEQYLLNTMPSGDKEVFERKLTIDNNLKQKLEDVKTLMDGIEIESLKDKLDVFYEDLVLTNDDIHTTKVIKLPWYRKFGVAASVVILLGLGSLWYFNINTHETLYANYFKADPGLPTLMGTEDTNFEFYDAMVNYKQGDYATAISKWNALLKTKTENDTLNYFVGVAKMANKDVNSAIPLLEHVTTTEGSAFKNEAYYYLGLAYLQANNMELAKKYLNLSTIANSKALLSELND
ncbi:hypothetical protein RM697_00460 [Ichthyenterobacterium sp. W332]|uniref:Tetratricopeptide repeat protein n=1 Tax=Microcosmobacter mediterraneus TaxID=3075607 RepID=A0ABU2YIN5_9FLAO|nr:hypothetical protein [Ichthyenterobacterium sp. W332]MDT0557095.1 hypothetical protein [Ichthyenterobacterium sp. W332]